ncbi:unnamed protein product [Rotaria sordida]|uniref:Cullin family profile domain-containing protein n=2 Tax=Rotaria sordida TaxID=392033 RepID=A0A815N046_9BILA|nr:unnamed protein product [Rotaria sordida]
MLAKRLINQLSTSIDYEESMISKLKQACGLVYTNKLQQMFQDVNISTNLSDQYRTYCENNKIYNTSINIDFSAMVLSTNAWPFSTPAEFVLPFELKITCDNFIKFYNQQHNGRKLTWLYQRSNGDLQILYTKSNYILHVSTYQMAILLVFNKFPKWTIEKMQDET